MDVFVSLLPLIVIFLIFYFIVIRPQSKAEAKRREFINNLKRGDIVVLSSGIIGKVSEIVGRTVFLEVSKDVRIRVLKDAIQGPYIEQKPQENKTKGDEDAKKDKEKEKEDKKQ